MPPQVCPRCRNTNPADAVYCHFDGTNLRSGAGAGADFNRLAQEFVFASGRKAKTFDELAQGFQDDWPTAREMLRRGQLQQYFGSIGRMDLAHAAQEAMTQPDADIGLTALLTSLPASKPLAPRLDLAPRRLQFVNVVAGEQRQIQITVSNQGQGMLAGTLSVGEDSKWLKLGAGNGKVPLKTTKEQQFLLQVDTRGLAAAQTYRSSVAVLTNGGTFEVPVKLDLSAHPFAKAPFKGARIPRELAEKMRGAPKAAVPILESGEVARWFTQNGWNYPVRGTPAKGVAGVQQFFEAMGLAKPPKVKLSQNEVRCEVTPPENVQARVMLQATSKKWVYASVESDQSWLKVLTPQVAGPQQAAIVYEIDARTVPRGRMAEGNITVTANGAQMLTFRVRVQVVRTATSIGKAVLRPVLAGMLLFFLLRFAIAPLVDGYARGAATSAAASRLTTPAPDSPLVTTGGWLKLPWFTTLLGFSSHAMDSYLGVPEGAPPGPTREFRDYFAQSFTRIVTLGTFWIGALAGGLVLARRGVLHIPVGVIAGTFAGLAAGVTLATLVLTLDLGPHLIWGTVLSGSGSGIMIPFWVVLTLVWWTAVGGALGMLLAISGPLGRPILAGGLNLLAWTFEKCGLTAIGEFFRE